jgi:hypothetical protein
MYNNRNPVRDEYGASIDDHMSEPWDDIRLIALRLGEDTGRECSFPHLLSTTNISSKSQVTDLDDS